MDAPLRLPRRRASGRRAVADLGHDGECPVERPAPAGSWRRSALDLLPLDPARAIPPAMPGPPVPAPREHGQAIRAPRRGGRRGGRIERSAERLPGMPAGAVPVAVPDAPSGKMTKTSIASGAHAVIAGAEAHVPPRFSSPAQRPSISARWRSVPSSAIQTRSIRPGPHEQAASPRPPLRTRSRDPLQDRLHLGHEACHRLLVVVGGEAGTRRR